MRLKKRGDIKFLSDVMDEVLPTVPPDAIFEDIVFLLKNNSAILVMSKGKLSGIITKADIIQHLLSD